MKIKMSKDFKMIRGVKYRNEAKTSIIPIKNLSSEQKILPKPEWLRIKSPPNSAEILNITQKMRRHGLNSVCEEASCPNLHECFHRGTATFMILGAICTRRCPFCAVAHGKPLPPDEREPKRLAETIADMGLKYVVLTSVNRDDLLDAGAKHFSQCVAEIRTLSPNTQIEILVPDFKGRMELALKQLSLNPPNVFNHNLESIPRLYTQIRPRANYEHSLLLLQEFKRLFPQIPTKSGLMLGLGESNAEILNVLADLRSHGVTMLTLGQYLQPSPHHLPVARYVKPSEFAELRSQALAMGFEKVASGVLVRSSYQADLQAQSNSVVK